MLSLWFYPASISALIKPRDTPFVLLNKFSRRNNRAISRNGCTELSKEEILEFLELVGTAKFVFIKVETKGFVRQYFMLLSNTIKVGHIQKRIENTKEICYFL